MRGHVRATCLDTCEGCNYCLGGLYACTVCGGAEGSLPTECPKEEMTDEQERAVFNGALDYINGRWDIQ